MEYLSSLFESLGLNCEVCGQFAHPYHECSLRVYIDGPVKEGEVGQTTKGYTVRVGQQIGDKTYCAVILDKWSNSPGTWRLLRDG